MNTPAAWTVLDTACSQPNRFCQGQRPALGPSVVSGQEMRKAGAGRVGLKGFLAGVHLSLSLAMLIPATSRCTRVSWLTTSWLYTERAASSALTCTHTTLMSLLYKVFLIRRDQLTAHPMGAPSDANMIEEMGFPPAQPCSASPMPLTDLQYDVRHPAQQKCCPCLLHSDLTHECFERHCICMPKDKHYIPASLLRCKLTYCPDALLDAHGNNLTTAWDYAQLSHLQPGKEGRGRHSLSA